MRNKIKLICITGIFTAIVYIFTAYLHIPSHTGYTHVGDGFIYLTASLLPLPYAVFTGAVGALLADCFTGFAIWAPASIIIKTLTVLFFTSKSKKIISVRNIIALLPSALLCIGGYYIYEAIITGNLITPLSGVLGYITQSVFSSILYIALGIALDKFKIKEHISKGK